MLDSGHPLVTLALVLGAGMTAGWLAKRISLPSITGQIVVGVLLGPSLIGVMSVEALHDLTPITDFALGLIAVAVGNHLTVKRLRRELRRLGWLVALEATLTPLLVFIAMRTFGVRDIGLDWMLGAMAIATAPATIVAIVAELRARGAFVRTLVAAVALNNMACVVLFEVARVYAHVDHGAEMAPMALLLGPGVKLLAPVVMGLAIAGASVLLTRRVMRSELLASASVVAILFATGVSELLQISPLLTSLFVGVGLANFTPDRDELGHRVFRDFENAIFAVFFTLAGMELDFDYLVQAGGLAVLYVLARAGGKLASAWLVMRVTGAPEPLQRYLGASLIPQAGVAIGLVMVVRDDSTLSDVAGLFLAVGLTSVTLNEIIGPIATRWAVRKSGEAGRDTPGAIDFLRPEHIVVGIEARDLEGAVRELAAKLVTLHDAELDAESLAEEALAQLDGAMFAGHGLAIPHARVGGSEEVRGVMGIAPDGLTALTPDGERVRCVLLLAVPHGAGDPHIEVAAALGRAIGSDAELERSLLHAPDAQSAFEVLHAFDDPDLNTVLARLDEDPS